MKSEAAFSHAYLLVSPQAEAGESAARRLAQAILCSSPVNGEPCGRCGNCRKAEKGVHPDILTVSRLPDEKGKPKREITVDQIRAIVADAAILPNEAEKKVYLILDAGAMNPAAQNALLKILEEPPRFVAFILVAEGVGTLLETVRSRCVIRNLSGDGDAPPPEARALAERYLDMAAAGARISLLSFANECGDLDGDGLLDFVRAAKLLLADMLCGRLPDRRLSHAELLRLAGLMDTAAEYLRFHVSPKHVMGLLTVETVPENRNNK